MSWRNDTLWVLVPRRPEQGSPIWFLGQEDARQALNSVTVGTWYLCRFALAVGPDAAKLPIDLRDPT